MEDDKRKQVLKTSLKCNLAWDYCLDVWVYSIYAALLCLWQMGCEISKAIACYEVITTTGSVGSNSKLFFLTPFVHTSPGDSYYLVHWLPFKKCLSFFLCSFHFFPSPQFGALCWHLNCAVKVNVPLQSGSAVHPLCTIINYLAVLQTTAIGSTPSTFSQRQCFLLLSRLLNLKGHCNWKHMFIILYGKYNTTYFLSKKPELLE